MSDVHPSFAFLSLRVQRATRDRLKAVAGARGETVQNLVGSLVARFLEEEACRPPALTTILTGLRGHAAELAQRGITALWVFGSVARGEAGLNSDIDLLAELTPEVTLLKLSSLRADLSELLGWNVDLVERSALHAEAIPTAEHDAVRVF